MSYHNQEHIEPVFHGKLVLFILSICFSTAILAMASCKVQAAPRLQTTEDPIVIVIDPGHGGANEGTTQHTIQEKTMAFVTAQAMYEELTQYDNVEVFLTRTDDRDMSLKERAAFAASVHADFLFSLHYNASENHTLFGTEVWVSSVAPYNAYGYQFGYEQLRQMQEKGLFLRGIKTRKNDADEDYYGIIRESVALSVPAVIIEHCHVDEERDKPYCETKEEWVAFGKADALAVAKYFGLSSVALGVDYGEESLSLPEVNSTGFVPSTIRDETEPDVCLVELIDTDYETGTVVLQVTATDYDSPILYYDYSTDGGITYSSMQPCPGLDLLEGSYQDTFSITLHFTKGEQPVITLRAYNQADLYTESAPITFLQPFKDLEQEAEAARQASLQAANIEESDHAKEHSLGTTTFLPANAQAVQAEAKEPSFFTFLQICLLIVILLFSIVLISQCISSYQRRKRRQRRKEAGKKRNHPR